jgi:hypothetical protein
LLNATFIRIGFVSVEATVASGVYFYQLTAGEFKQVRRMVVVK